MRWLQASTKRKATSTWSASLYEELLWWLLMPSLLRLAGEAAPNRASVEELSKTVAEALATAEAAHYRIDALLGSAASG